MRYPIYVISKGRYERCLTARCFVEHGVPFTLVVEPQEADEYRARFGDAVAVLPFSNLGLGSIPARNWVWEHARESGAFRHWIFDDNIRGFRRYYDGRRLKCPPQVCIDVAETFTDRYENVAIAGFNYDVFAIPPIKVPFRTNCHVYSSLLIRNDLPQRWRGRYNEDTDLCLQVLSAGWCTVQFQAFLIQKIATMQMAGGNTDQLYAGDGRLKMARSLERMWPGVVTVDRRWERPQHVVDWKRFASIPLIRRPDADDDGVPDTLRLRAGAKKKGRAR